MVWRTIKVMKLIDMSISYSIRVLKWFGWKNILFIILNTRARGETIEFLDYVLLVFCLFYFSRGKNDLT